jgi:predicted RND superfamily exporter protein
MGSWSFGAPRTAGGGSFGSEGDSEKLKDEYSAEFFSLYEEAKDLVDTASNGKFRAILMSQLTAEQQLYGLLYHDGFLAIFSFVLVFWYMWFSTESFFLTACGMSEILMSIPPAMLAWHFINGNGITSLQFLVIYMILGIGADDVFVLLDAWKQARCALGKEASTTQVFALGYRRAFSAMLTTTFTTGAAFLFGAFSPIPMVAHFCVFAALVVIFDYIWCVSFFASAVCVYERYFEGHTCCCMGTAVPGKCGGPGCCWGGIRVMWVLRI